MTIFEQSAPISAPIGEVYAFLENCNNHQALQPDSISDWTSTDDEASFTIKNMATLRLRITGRIPNKAVLFVPVGQTPFALSLRWTLSQSDTGTLAVLTLQAELNMMMQMLAKKPLQELVNYQVSKLKELLP